MEHAISPLGPDNSTKRETCVSRCTLYMAASAAQLVDIFWPDARIPTFSLSLIPPSGKKKNSGNLRSMPRTSTVPSAAKA